MAAEDTHFRFEAFGDAARAQAAFEAAYPPGSPIEPALQALTRMGAQCKTAGPNRVACRYVEKEQALAGWSWQVALERSQANTLERVRIDVAITGM
jgi:hypothetical protein